MPLFNPSVEPDVPGQIYALTDKAVPVGADDLLLEDSADGYSKKKIRVDRVCPASVVAEDSSTTTTTASTYTLVSTMSITPEAGTYLVTFSGTITNGSTGGYTYVSIYYNGALVGSSERMYYRSGTQAQRVPFCCQAKMTVNGSLAIEGRWYTSGTSTGTMYSRTISAVRVS